MEGNQLSIEMGCHREREREREKIDRERETERVEYASKRMKLEQSRTNMPRRYGSKASYFFLIHSCM